MRLRTKICSIVAAALLSVGLIGGTALANTSNPTVTLTLDGGTTTCSPTLGSATLGTYLWGVGGYSLQTQGKLTITVGISEAYGKSGDTCGVTAYLGTLMDASGHQISFAAGKGIILNSETSGDGTQSANPLSNSSASPSTLGIALAPNTYNWDAGDISSLLNAMGQPNGTYTGTLTLTGTITGTSPS